MVLLELVNIEMVQRETLALYLDWIAITLVVDNNCLDLVVDLVVLEVLEFQAFLVILECHFLLAVLVHRENQIRLEDLK